MYGIRNAAGVITIRAENRRNVSRLNLTGVFPGQFVQWVFGDWQDAEPTPLPVAPEARTVTEVLIPAWDVREDDVVELNGELITVDEVFITPAKDVMVLGAGNAWLLDWEDDVMLIEGEISA